MEDLEEAFVIYVIKIFKYQFGLAFTKQSYIEKILNKFNPFNDTSIPTILILVLSWFSIKVKELTNMSFPKLLTAWYMLCNVQDQIVVMLLPC